MTNPNKPSSPFVDLLRSLIAWGGVGMALIFGIMLYSDGFDSSSEDTWILVAAIVFFLLFAACIAPLGDDE